MKLEWEKISETQQRVGYRVITQKEFRLPDGKEETFTTVGKPTQNTAIIAVTKDKKIVIAKQFRPGPEKVLYELPGGMVDDGETPQEAAKRELLEETGYKCVDELIFLGTACRDAYKNETDNYFLGLNCIKIAEQHLESTEFIEVTEIAIATLVSNAKNGLMSDAPAVLMAYEMLMKIQEGGSE